MYRLYISYAKFSKNYSSVFLIVDETSNQFHIGKCETGVSGASLVTTSVQTAINGLTEMMKYTQGRIELVYNCNFLKKNLSVSDDFKALKVHFKNVKLVYAHPDNNIWIKRAGEEALLFLKQSTQNSHETADLIPDFIAYTDGSCNNLSPYGEGGAAYILLDGLKNIIKQSSKGFVGVTNNKMELMAILSAVASVPAGSTLIVYTDSQYCIRVLTNNANANNFTRPNANVIRQYFNYASRLKDIRFEWVKGHDGNEFNEMVDALAQSRTEEMRTIHNIPVYDYRNSPKCRR